MSWCAFCILNFNRIQDSITFNSIDNKLIYCRMYFTLQNRNNLVSADVLMDLIFCWIIFVQFSFCFLFQNKTKRRIYENVIQIECLMSRFSLKKKTFSSFFVYFFCRLLFGILSKRRNRCAILFFVSVFWRRWAIQKENTVKNKQKTHRKNESIENWRKKTEIE